jgi:hypothetical protein
MTHVARRQLRSACLSTAVALATLAVLCAPAVGSSSDIGVDQGSPARPALPDLVPGGGSASFKNDRLAGRMTVKNRGRAKSRASSTAIVWQIGGRRTRQRLGALRTPALAIDDRTTLRFKLNLPRHALPGVYAVHACADGRAQIEERHETNNCIRLGAVEIPASFFDTTPPDGEIVAGPSGTTVSNDPEFSFGATGAESGGSVRCRLDGPDAATGSFADCTSPTAYTDLADGSYTLSVVAVDAAGNEDPSPATRTFTVDTTPPDTVLGEALPPARTSSAAADLAFSSADPSDRFECRLDSDAWTACDSPRSLSGLADGHHDFDVRAVDASGNAELTPAQHTWSVDTTAPDTSIDSGPDGRVAERTAAFGYSAGDAEDLDRFECALDGEEFRECGASKLVVDRLDHGAHLLRVRAVDTLGNADSTPATRRFVVDVTPPDTEIRGAPPELTAQRAASFDFRGAPVADTDRYECSVDGAPFARCPSAGLATAQLADGDHDVRVRAIDAVGNVDPSPASHTWTIDSTAPETSIADGPEGETQDAKARFSFESPDEDVDHFECAMDSDTFTSCAASGASFRGLIDGEHSFSVRAVDAIGNTDESAAVRRWTVDAIEPPADAGPATPIAELFPTSLRESIPAEGSDPSVGRLATSGGFAIENGATGSIGSTLSDGAVLHENGVTLGVTPAGASRAVGVAGDDAVLYDGAGENDTAIRPTGDTGVEVLSHLPEGRNTATYKLDLPRGSHLEHISNGDVAIVDPNTAPQPELAEIGRQIEDAKSQVVAASIESAADSTDEAQAHAELADGFERLEPPTVDAPASAPSRAELIDDAGEIPAYADPDATLAQVEAAVEDLERGVSPTDLTPQDRVAIEKAEAAYSSAKELSDKLVDVQALAVEAEASRLFDKEMAEILAEQVVDDLESTADADLDIGDSSAEQLRSGMKAVTAQSEVENGRVVGLISAPMAKAEGGEPIASSLEIVDGSSVAVSVPPGFEADAVADPVFVVLGPLLVTAARVAAQRLAPIAVRAAVQVAKKVLSKAGSAATRVAPQIVTKVRQTQAALRAAASAARSAAARVVAQVRAAAAAAARAAAQGGSRLQAQAAEARRIAAEQVRRVQTEAKKAFDEARDLGRRAREDVLTKRAEIARQVEATAREQIKSAVDKAVTAGREVREVLTVAKDRIAQLMRSRLEAAREYLRRSATADDLVREGVRIAAQESIGKLVEELTGDEIKSKCYVPAIASRIGGPVPTTVPAAGLGLGFVGVDVIRCVTELYKKAMSSIPLDVPDEGETAYPTEEELRQILDDSLLHARTVGLGSLANFSPPPLGAPERQTAVVGTTVPPAVEAGRTGFIQITAVNQGQPLPLDNTFIATNGAFPYVHAGYVPGQPDRILLTDENSDGRWDHGEVVNAVVEVTPPVMRSSSTYVEYGFVSGGVGFSGGNQMTINVDGPREDLRVYNMVTNGPVAMREDTTPARLTTHPWTFCTRRGCNIYGTERGTGGTYSHAVCRTTGEWTTNGDDRPGATSDDHNPNRYSSNEYYGVQLGGTFGYVSWVWIHPDDRGGLGLPYC